MFVAPPQRKLPFCNFCSRRQGRRSEALALAVPATTRFAAVRGAAMAPPCLGSCAADRGGIGGRAAWLHHKAHDAPTWDQVGPSRPRKYRTSLTDILLHIDAGLN